MERKLLKLFYKHGNSKTFLHIFHIYFYYLILTKYFFITALPFIKNPEDNPAYSVHFSRHWQDTMLISLHNFIATIFQVSSVFIYSMLNLFFLRVIMRADKKFQISFDQNETIFKSFLL